MEDDPLLALAMDAIKVPQSRPSGTSEPIKQLEMIQHYNNKTQTTPSLIRKNGITGPGVIPILNPIQNQLGSQNGSSAPSASRHVRHIPPSVSQSTSSHSASLSFLDRRNPPTSTAPSTSTIHRGYKDLGQGSFIRKHSDLRIKNPLVSSAQLESRFASQSIIKLKEVKSRCRSDSLVSRWITIGVVGEISNTRVASKGSGSEYKIWKITDLDATSLSMFLFGRAYDDYKTDVNPGDLVALLSPKIRKDNEFSLSVDREDQVLILGQAMDFGYCASKTKNGGPCRVPVNTSICQFCSHHVSKEYNRLNTKRIELQGGTLKTAFRKGLQRSLDWKPGTFQPLEAAQKPIMTVLSAEKLKEAAAMAIARSGNSTGARYLKTVADPRAARAAVQEMEAAKMQQRNRTQNVHGGAPIPLSRTSTVVYEPSQAVSKKKRLLVVSASNPTNNNSSENKRIKKTDSNAIHNDDMIELEEGDDIVVEGAQQSVHVPLSEARQRAVEILKSSATDMTAVKKTTQAASNGTAIVVDRNKWPAFLKAGVEAKEKDQGASPAEQPPQLNNCSKDVDDDVLDGPIHGAWITKKSSVNQRSNHKKTGSTNLQQRKPSSGVPSQEQTGFAAAFGSVIAEMEAQCAANPADGTGTLYKQLVEDDDQKRLFACIDALENKDAMAQKMDSITAMTVNAWNCESCQIITEYRPRQCGQNHPKSLKRVSVVKRWWQCDGCKGRFNTLGKPYPSGPCPKCNAHGLIFTRVSMLKPRNELEQEMTQGPIASRDMLTTRGSEQKWVNM